MCTEWRDLTEVNELTWCSFWRTGQWAGSNALHSAPSNGVSIYVTTATYAATNDWWVHSLASLSKTKPCQFSSVRWRHTLVLLLISADCHATSHHLLPVLTDSWNNNAGSRRTTSHLATLELLSNWLPSCVSAFYYMARVFKDLNLPVC